MHFCELLVCFDNAGVFNHYYPFKTGIRKDAQPPFAFPQSVFRPFAFGNIPDQRPHGAGAVVIVLDEKRPKFHREDGAVFPPVFLFVGVRVSAGQNLCPHDFCLELAPPFRGEIGITQCFDFCGSVAEHFYVSFVEFLDVALHVDTDERIPHAFMQSAIFDFRLLQRFFGMFPGSDVGSVTHEPGIAASGVSKRSAVVFVPLDASVWTTDPVFYVTFLAAFCAFDRFGNFRTVLCMHKHMPFIKGVEAILRIHAEKFE